MISNTLNGGNLIKSKGQLLKEADKKIAELEKQVDQLCWLVASARSGVAALALHFEQTPEQVKVIYDAYCEKENAKILAQNEEMKKKFVQDLKDGKKSVEFTVLDNPDKANA